MERAINPTSQDFRSPEMFKQASPPRPKHRPHLKYPNEM